MFKRLLVATGFMALLLFPSIARAQDTSNNGALNLTTSPLPVSMVGKPGETVSTKLSVKNGGAKAEELKVSLLKFSAYGEDGKPQLLDRAVGDKYFDWVHFSENTFVMQPGQSHEVTMFVDFPGEASLGYYYAVTFSRLNPPKSDQTNKLEGGTAVLVLAEARTAGEKRSIELESFTASKKVFEFLPATLQIKLKNTGNIHLAPSGNVFIFKGSEKVATLDVNQGGGNILPDSKRVFTSEWTEGFPVYETKKGATGGAGSDGKAATSLKWDLSKISSLRFGKYKAILTMAYSDGVRDVPVEATVNFWVIPWRIIAFILIPIIIFIAVLVGYIKLKRRTKKSGSGDKK